MPYSDYDGKKCRECKHFLQIHFIDAKCYFCNNPQTKEGEYPIGFLREDAPACELFEREPIHTTTNTELVVLGDMET